MIILSYVPKHGVYPSILSMQLLIASGLDLSSHAKQMLSWLQPSLLSWVLYLSKLANLTQHSNFAKHLSKRALFGSIKNASSFHYKAAPKWGPAICSCLSLFESLFFRGPICFNIQHAGWILWCSMRLCKIFPRREANRFSNAWCPRRVIKGRQSLLQAFHSERWFKWTPAQLVSQFPLCCPQRALKEAPRRDSKDSLILMKKLIYPCWAILWQNGSILCPGIGLASQHQRT